MDTRQLLQTLRPEINAALAVIATKHGLKSLHCGNATFSSGGSFVFKLEGVLAGGLDKDAERYANSMAMLKLPPLGTSFSAGGKSYKTVGLNTTGSKVVIERADGKRFLQATDVVSRLCAPLGTSVLNR